MADEEKLCCGILIIAFVIWVIYTAVTSISKYIETEGYFIPILILLLLFTLAITIIERQSIIQFFREHYNQMLQNREKRINEEYFFSRLNTIKGRVNTELHFWKPELLGILRRSELTYDKNRKHSIASAKGSLVFVESILNSGWDQQILKWKEHGYDTKPVETLPRQIIDSTIPDEKSVFADCEKFLKGVKIINKIQQELKEIRFSHPEWITNPELGGRFDDLNHFLNQPARGEEIAKLYNQILEEYAQKQYNNIKFGINQLSIAGIPFDTNLSVIQSLMSKKEYIKSIEEADRLLGLIKEKDSDIQKKADALRDSVKSENLVRLYDTQKYVEFIKETEHMLVLRENLYKFKNEAQEKIAVPEIVEAALISEDPDMISIAINELQFQMSTAIPALTITLKTDNIRQKDWNRIPIVIENKGNAHARDIQISFSRDIENRKIPAVNLSAGETKTIDIWIRSDLKGTIPLEITTDYYNVSKDKTYSQVHDLLLNVTPEIPPVSSYPRHPSENYFQTPLLQTTLPLDLTNKYTDVQFIGKGGFARVFKARRSDGVNVAVKVPITFDASTGKSFLVEMQNWTKLDHPNIVRIYDFNILPIPYFELELCDGSLAEIKKPVDIEEAAWIIFNVCEGLKYAHARSIIHRDLKPRNILVKGGAPKISDWGLSRVISESPSTSTPAFSPQYAAPEQIGNRPKDERTDIWQIGAILYEMVTGITPFSGESMIEIGMNIATKNPKAPCDINPAARPIEHIIMKCLEKDQSKRYQSIIDLQKALGDYLNIRFVESLEMSITGNDVKRSAQYCGDLVMLYLRMGNLSKAYKYTSDFVNYTPESIRQDAKELSEQILVRVQYGITDIPEELLIKAETIIHKANLGITEFF